MFFVYFQSFMGRYPGGPGGPRGPVRMPPNQVDFPNVSINFYFSFTLYNIEVKVRWLL